MTKASPHSKYGWYVLYNRCWYAEQRIDGVVWMIYDTRDTDEVRTFPHEVRDSKFIKRLRELTPISYQLFHQDDSCPLVADDAEVVDLSQCICYAR